MGSTYRYIADPSEPSPVMDWFRSLPLPPKEVATPYGAALHFEQYGPIVYHADGKINAKASPLVTVFLPQIKRGILWTVGEIHFLSTPLRGQYPALYRSSAAFAKWMKLLPCVFDIKSKENEFNYYLEGSVRNRDAPLYAFESGLSALRSERYFVAHGDGDNRIETICKSLRLRGVECN